MRRLFPALIVLFAAALPLGAQNPYLPLWEHIPDGEPYVFEDPDNPGRQRVYVYGSHDNLRSSYCGLDQVVWSAPVEDLSAWRYDGVIFTSRYGRDGSLLNPGGRADLLFAPDVAEVIENGRKVYYLCPNVQNGGRQNLIAKSSRPDGPFEVCNWNPDGRSTYGVFGFDPALFVDDDGRVYGYWGFGRSCGAELDPATMCTVKEGTEIVRDLVSGYEQDGVFRFYEASSMRKIDGKYVLVYSRVTSPGEFGLPACNYTLAYAYSDNPLGPFTYGGTLIDGRARSVGADGKPVVTANVGGNTHGSLCRIGEKWWVFYHRQSGTNEFSRQAMVAPVEVKVVDGRVEISEAEYNSEGFRTGGLNPLQRQPAGLACHYTGPSETKVSYPDYHFSGSYVRADYLEDNPYHFAPVVNNTAGSVVGYKYLNFNSLKGRRKVKLILGMMPLGVEGEIVVLVDGPSPEEGGVVIGKATLSGTEAQRDCELAIPVKPGRISGKHALYFRFESPEPGRSLCELYSFVFVTD
ncbi:MAG: family 43 glycosylhydrolase [Bacteroidales bacterium]|nr:family 43 glycosylhydrolase [Bacteroidales bacterium]